MEMQPTITHLGTRIFAEVSHINRAGAISPVYPFATSWLVSAAAGDPILFHDQCVHVGNNESTPIDCTGAIHDVRVTSDLCNQYPSELLRSAKDF